MHPQRNPTACPESHQNVQSKTGTRSSQCPTAAKSSVWRRGWKTLASILGFYILAWICAIAHYSVFSYLDGRIIHQDHTPLSYKSTRVPQTYATTVSLVLVTAFRAALIACVGSCYAQYLWKELRSQLLEVGLIEELFRIRSNPFRLLNQHLVRNTPILVLIAGFSWLVPVTMIYPPGALIVRLDIRKLDAEFNVSVFQPNNIYPPQIDMLYTNGLALVLVDDSNTNGTMQNPCNANSSCRYQLPNLSLNYLSTSVLISGKIASMHSPSGDNVSYTLKFRGPVMQCSQTPLRNETILHEHNITLTDYGVVSSRNSKLYISGNAMRSEDQAFSLKTLRSGTLDYFPCIDESQDTGTGPNSWIVNITVLQQLEKLECLPGTAQYTVNITYINGQQSVDYSVIDKQLLPRLLFRSSKEFYSNQHIGLRTLRSFEEYANVLALIDSSLSYLHGEGTIIMGIKLNSSPKKSRFPNGTTVEVCSADRLMITYTDNAILPNTNFNPRKKSFVSSNGNNESIIVTEALLNSLLANVTISALSLNTWYDLVNGTETRPFNIYRFESKLNFFLPYGLSLLLAIPIISIGLLAIRDNGVTAIDGGFLQILMTTTGRTKLEAAAVKGSAGGEESITPELEKLQVRFGELIVDEKTLVGEKVVNVEAETIDNAPRGTLDEMIPLEQLELGEQEARSVVSNFELREWSRTESRVGSDGMVEYAEVASGADGCLSESHVVRRLGFGTIDETKPMKKGV